MDSWESSDHFHQKLHVMSLNDIKESNKHIPVIKRIRILEEKHYWWWKIISHTPDMPLYLRLRIRTLMSISLLIHLSAYM